jgi:HAE1 family hydrophobic/amphiphilic exporter-1
VSKQSGTNTVEVARRVLAEIELINEDIPQIHLTPIIDTSAYVERSIANVGSSAILGGFFAILVLLVFLRSVRGTAVVAVAIPVSIIATFALIYLCGFTLNLMTLGGLALGVGMLVDNAIVVLENIYSHRQGGSDAITAAVEGAEEVSSAVVASTMTTLAVFVPLIFVRGMAGVMFMQLALVVSFSLLCALGVSLTVVPMLAARVLRAPGDYTDSSLGSRIYRLFGSFFEYLENDYKALLHQALKHRFIVVFFSILLLVSSLMLVPLIGVEMMPQTDEGEVRVDLEMEVGTRLDIVDDAIGVVEALLPKEVPELASVVTTVGGSGHSGGSSHTAELRISLIPRARRTRSSDEIAAALRSAIKGIPGATIRVRTGTGLFLLRRMTGGTERLEVEIRGHDMDTAGALAQRVKDIAETIPGVTDAKVNSDIGAPERIITVDRAKAESMSVTVKQVAAMLQTVVSGTRAGNFRDDGDEFFIRVKVKDAEKLSLERILDLTISNSDGQSVVLRNLLSLAPRTGPVSIERKDQERLVSVRANIHGRDLGSITEDLRLALLQVPVPAGFSIGFGSDYTEQNKAFTELAIGLILALTLVYMVMACLYESLRDPFVVMFSVPLAIIGVILMLFLTDTTFNIQSYIGCFMLGGIVVNNAILLVDYTNLLRQRDGMTTVEALKETGRRRLRPILMTTMTTVCGLAPLALGLGEGGEAQAPLARAVIGGLLSSTFITLLVVPVIYSLFEDKG